MVARRSCAGDDPFSWWWGGTLVLLWAVVVGEGTGYSGSAVVVALGCDGVGGGSEEAL